MRNTRMKSETRRFVSTLLMASLIIAVSSPIHAQESLVAKTVVECADEICEATLRLTGRAVSKSARKRMVKILMEAELRHGDDVLRAARVGGVDLVEAAGRHGDEIWRLSKAVPGGARVLASHADELMPLVRRVGPDALRLEAKAPGAAKMVVERYGEKAIPYFAKEVSAAECPRLLGYAAKADSPEARRLLLECYKKQGPSLLDRLNWKHIMAGGLSVAAITAAYEAGEGVREGVNVLAKNNPGMLRDIAGHTVNLLLLPFCVLVIGVGLVVSYKLLRRRSAKRGDR